MAIPTSSTCMSATSATRSIGRSNGHRWKRSAASATASGTRPTMRIPLRLRLTLVFSVAMGLVLLGLGTYAYLRISADLLASVDAGLRSRAQVLADAVGSVGVRDVVNANGKLIDPDEA